MNNIVLSTRNIDDFIIDVANEVAKKITKLNSNVEKENDFLDKWFGLDELIKYDPAKRTKATWYSIVSRGEVPHHKNGKHLVFLKSEIDEWLRSGKRKSNKEIEQEAEAYLSNNKKGGING